MLVYLLKFSACLAIFLVFYKFFLERESMHHLKRYFLLSALILALGIPLITFTQYVEPIIANTASPSFDNFETFSEIPDVPVEVDYTPIILWTIYGLGVLLFGIKFLWNLSNIYYKIRHNPKQKSQTFIHVLLNDLIIPHTFFSYIFLNRQKFENNEIPQEVFWHEQAHAKQKHSLDVLFIELLQVVFWFNPLIYLAKHAIKLNHEFLADQAVLNQGIQPSAYQQILLEFSSPDNQREAQEPKLANAINYSSIKKRFTVMKTHTSKQKIWLRSLLLLPLVAVTLYGFSDTKEVIKENTVRIIENDTIPNISIYINDNDDIFLNKNQVVVENLYEEINKLNAHLTTQQKRTYLFASIQYEDEKSQDTIKTIQDILFKSDVFSSSTSNVSKLKTLGVKSEFPKSKYAGKTLEQAEKIYSEETLDFSPKQENNTNSPWQISVGVNAVSFTEVDDSEQMKNATPQMIEEYNAIVKDFNSKPEDKKIVKLKDFDRLNFITGQMSDEQRKSALPFPNIYNNQSINEVASQATNQNSPWQIGVGVSEVTFDDDDSNKQTTATPAEVEWYNKLITEVNSNPEDRRIFKQKDINRLEDIYKRMSKEQKAKAEPFPKFPPPPSPETGFIEVNGETLYFVKFIPPKYFNKNGYLVDKTGKLLNGNNQVNASDVLPGQYITKIFKNDDVVVEFNDNAPELQKIKQQSKSKEMVMLNGKKSTDGNFTLTKEELNNLDLTIDKGEITDFKFKIPGKSTVSITGNKLNEEAKSLLKYLFSGDAVQLFIIKNSDNAEHPPILIQIK